MSGGIHTEGNRLSWKWQTTNDRIKGFNYLWAKKIEGFDPSVHCAKCLLGKYSRQFSPQMQSNIWIESDYKVGDILYFCGVSTPYKWSNNLHIAGIVSKGSIFQMVTYTGDRIVLRNFERLEFDEAIATNKYHALGDRFLTCRNFQFGASLSELLRSVHS